MNKEQVLQLFKKIHYPGFSRDIVSFGMVKDIQITNDQILVNLNITSQNEDKKKLVCDNIKNVLNQYFNNVIIELSTDSHKQATAPLGDTPSILNNVKNIVAIASGKGGVGKSTIAANLACALTKHGKKVGLLDLDIYGPSLPIVFDLHEQPKMTQDKKLIPLEKFGVKVMSFGFISGNDTPVIWRGPLVSRMTEQFFRDVEWGEFDLMVLDLPPRTGDIQLTLTQKLKMTGAIIVTTPQDIALADVRKGADMFRKVNTPVLGVVENMSGLILEGFVNTPESNLTIDKKRIDIKEDGSFRVKLDLFKKDGGKKESERLGVPLLGKIPISEKIMLSTDLGKPFIINDNSDHIGEIFLNISNQLLDIIDK